MTYCIGIRVREGLVALADARITSGAQVSSARKITLHGAQGSQFFVMTSGLRSLRDKTLAYLERDRGGKALETMLDAVGAYCRALRQVDDEDRAALQRSNIAYNLHAIVGGQLAGDSDATMFLVYPEGNWIQLDERTPHLSIGVTGYGKPILDRALRYDTPLRTALKLAFLSFDSTRLSSSDVGYPIDVLSYALTDRKWREGQFNYDDQREQSQWWNENLTRLVTEMPNGRWIDTLLP